MASARRPRGGKHAANVSRGKRRTAAIAASALVTLPVALFGNVAADWVSTAASTPAPVTPKPTNPTALGATGAIGQDEKLSPTVLNDAGNPVALTDDSGPLANLPSGPLGIPGIVLQAYENAAQQLAFSDPSCRIPWWLLAGIGKVESDQAENGEVDQNGNTLRPIYGPLLDGSGGFAAIPDTDGGALDGSATWDRAVGPMQFLPGTWRQYGTGNPNNVFDAALAAGRYLCASGGNLSDPAQQAIAVFNYNHSDSYVRTVLIWADAYEQGVTPLPETLVSSLQPEAKGNPIGSGSSVNTQAGPDGTLTTTITTPTPAGTITSTVTTSPSGTTTTTTRTTTTTTTAPVCTPSTTPTTTTTPSGTTSTTTPTSTTPPTSTTTTTTPTPTPPPTRVC